MQRVWGAVIAAALLAGCAGVSTPAPTRPPPTRMSASTVIAPSSTAPVPTPTAWPTVTATLTPILTSTPTRQPLTTPCPNPTPGGSVSQILFSAVECTGDSCEPFDGDVAPIYLINSDGSGMQQIYEGIGVIGDLNLSPDGTKLAFTDIYGHGVSNVYVLDLISGHAWSLVPDDTSQKIWRPRWVSNDRLVFIKIDGMNSSAFQSNLYSVNVDGIQLRQLTDHPPRTGIRNVSVSPDGTQLLFAEYLLDSADVTTVYRMNMDGTELTELITMTLPLHTVSMEWSPTGERIVVYPYPFFLKVDYAPVYMTESDGVEMRKIADLPGRPSLLAWTEDQTGLIFYVCSGTLGTNEIVEVRGDGSVRLLATGAGKIPACPFFGSLSPDRRWFAFSTSKELSILDISGGCHYQILTNYTVTSMLWLPEDIVFQPMP